MTKVLLGGFYGHEVFLAYPTIFDDVARPPVLLVIKIAELGHELSYFKKIQDLGVDFHFIMLLNSKT